MAEIITMPKLSDTMTVGTLVKWLKKEGDAVKSGDMLAEVETDKATMELESFFDGTLIKIFANAGSEVAIGAGLCAIGKPGEAVDAPPTPAAKGGPAQSQKSETSGQKPESKPASAPEASKPALSPVATPPDEPRRSPQGGGGQPAAPSPAPASGVQPSALSAPPSAPDARVRISPLARKIAADQKIDPALLTGTGPHGRIVKADVLAAAANPSLLKKPAAASGGGVRLDGPSLLKKGPLQEERMVPATNMRATIARRLLEAKTQIPHFYLEIEVDAAPLLELRSQLNSGLEKEGVKLSVNDFILKASAEALRRVPAVNASWTGSGIQYYSAAHVSFAVAIDDGLITPVIRDAHLKSVFAISAEAKPLGKRAKEKKLKPDEFSGGTFCVSNLGMMGVERFSAIINPPNSAIVAVGTTVTKPVVKNGQIVVGQTMVLTLSCDHRVVDGALGAQFLGALKDLLEKPALLLV
ncbi:MAG TPA: pyruvate dehydrogenase complex dihydrolipoamide acetyltransferase [Candidatus Didemnitutus sp.]|nr:pyruvate dehydrogenase complex dihydrolipoamide acetyltransferase [Candidatus Didemnitutus sp.]